MRDDFAFEEGLFSGYDAEKRQYDKSSWNYQFDENVFIELVVPGRFIVLAFFRIVAAEQPLFEGKIIPHQQAGIGVMLNVLGIDLVIFDQVQLPVR